MTQTDASALVALVDDRQKHSARCHEAFVNVDLPLITTWAVFGEAMYLLGRIGGWPLQNTLWRYVDGGLLVFHTPSAEENARMTFLMEQYRDRPMDLADASLVAAAEVRGDTRMFTLDSDFHIYRFNGREPFEVIP